MAFSPKERFYKKYFSAKDIFYPMRPLLTLAIGVALFALGMSGIFGASFLIWLGVTITSDDIIIYPWLRVNKLYTNLTRGHKSLKSGIGLAAIILALAAGLALGIFFCATNPVFLAGLIAIKASMDSSITIIIACQVLGGFISKAFGKPTLLGVFLGGLVALFIPVTIPLAIEAVTLATTMCTFFAAIVSKQAMRLFSWIVYGHTNADGYHYAHKTDKVLNIDEQQAKVYNVSPENIRTLRESLIDGVKHIKKVSHIGNEIQGTTGQMTTPYKDMLQLLTTAKTEQEADLLREMIKEYNPHLQSDSRPYDTIGMMFSFKNKQHERAYDRNRSQNLSGAFLAGNDYDKRDKYFSFWNKQGFESSIAKFNDAHDHKIRRSPSQLRQTFAPFVTPHA